MKCCIKTQIIDIMMAVIIIVSALGPVIQKKLAERKAKKQRRGDK